MKRFTTYIGEWFFYVAIMALGCWIFVHMRWSPMEYIIAGILLHEFSLWTKRQVE